MLLHVHLHLWSNDVLLRAVLGCNLEYLFISQFRRSRTNILDFLFNSRVKALQSRLLFRATDDDGGKKFGVVKGQVSTACYVTQAFEELSCSGNIANERLASNCIQDNAFVAHGMNCDNGVDAAGAAIRECVIAKSETVLSNRLAMQLLAS